MYGWIGKWMPKGPNELNDQEQTDKWLDKILGNSAYSHAKTLIWKIDFIKAVISDFVKAGIGCICRQVAEYKTQ